MTHRSTAWSLGILLLLLPLLVVAGDASDTVTLTLPRGNPEAGRAAFVELSCSSCHRVAGDDELPNPVSANPGPTLGRYQGRQAPARLGTSIISPSHEITGVVREPEDDLSPMGDFSEAMTVRQFLDLIAYLRSLETGTTGSAAG